MLCTKPPLPELSQILLSGSICDKGIPLGVVTSATSCPATTGVPMPRDLRHLEFERLCFESAIREHPGEQTHQEAFTDWLQERCGYSVIGAKRIVTRVVREAVDQWCRDRVETWLNSDGVGAARLRHLVRHSVESEDPDEAPVRVVCSGAAPDYAGCELTYCGGSDYPTGPGYHSYRRNEDDTVRVISEWVEVGHKWIMSKCEQFGIRIAGLSAEGGPYA